MPLIGYHGKKSFEGMWVVSIKNVEKGKDKISSGYSKKKKEYSKDSYFWKLHELCIYKTAPCQ